MLVVFPTLYVHDLPTSVNLLYHFTLLFYFRLYHLHWSGCNHLIHYVPICLNITHLFSLIRLRCLCLVVSRRVESATYGSLLPLSVYAQSLRLHEGVNFSPSLFLIPSFKTPVVLPRFYASARNPETTLALRFLATVWKSRGTDKIELMIQVKQNMKHTTKYQVMWVWSLRRRGKQNCELSHIDRTHQDPRVYNRIQNFLFHISMLRA